MPLCEEPSGIGLLGLSVALRVERVDLPQRAPADVPGALGDLDQPRDVVDEEDQQDEGERPEHTADRDREPRDLVGTDRPEGDQRVDEDADEDADRHLRHAVAEEVRQQPGAELARRELEDDDGHRERQPGHRHQRAGDRRHDRARRTRVAAEDERAAGRGAVVDPHEPDRQNGQPDHDDRRDEPEPVEDLRQADEDRAREGSS